MKDIRLLYDKGKTIKDNAELIGVSERTIKNYMANHEISGYDNNHHNRVSQLIQVEKQLTQKGIKPTIENLSKNLQWSKNTIVKYKKIIESNLKEGKENIPTFGISKNMVLKNCSENQSEILRNIILLHNNGIGFYCDVTYHLGNFYEKSKKFYVPEPTIKMDITPQFKDVIKILPMGKLPIDNNTIPSLVIDLPFIISPTDSPSTQVDKKTSNIIQRHFGSYPTKEAMFESYSHFIKEAYRVLQHNGICIIKCQSTISSSIQIMMPEFCWYVAQQSGFYVLDQFFLIAKKVLHSSKIQHQIHARKHTSTFLVLKKCNKKVGYFKI
jgi:hypothetical protein